jgi:predicted NUDIX family phosphoesterase
VPNILAVKKTDLVGLPEGFTGCKPDGSAVLEFGEDEIMNTILQKGFWTERSAAEKNELLKQIIVYTAIVNPQQKKIFLYRRASDQKYDEIRLRNKWSCGLGSHISEEKDGAAAPLINSFIREIKEEVGLKTGVRGFQPIGYINQESDEVGRVHLGILNIVRTGFSIIKPADPEIAEGHMVYFHVANTILNHPDTEPEGWTKIVFPKIIDWFS